GAIPKRPTLVCPATDTGIGRMLILDHDRDAAQYLGAAVELCHQIGAKPIVLTIARSMRAALNRQQWAQSIVHGMGLSADFDVLPGREIRNTALAIARWRRCQLVVMDCEQSQSWLRWLRGAAGIGTVSPNHSVAFLTMREGTANVGAQGRAAATR